MEITVNGVDYDLGDIDPGTPLLWVLRDHLKLTGTKYGCGRALCGACTVHRNGEAVRSCSLRVGEVGIDAITTIEGLAPDADAGHLHPVQQAWMDLAVPQCGFCQPGQIMSAAALIRQVGTPSDQQIDDAMGAHICRCGTYTRIRAAIKQAGEASR